MNLLSNSRTQIMNNTFERQSAISSLAILPTSKNVKTLPITTIIIITCEMNGNWRNAFVQLVVKFFVWLSKVLQKQTNNNNNNHYSLILIFISNMFEGRKQKEIKKKTKNKKKKIQIICASHTKWVNWGEQQFV